MCESVYLCFMCESSDGLVTRYVTKIYGSDMFDAAYELHSK